LRISFRYAKPDQGDDFGEFWAYPSEGHMSRAIKGLGEIALRVRDLDTMQGFYEEVIGLQLLKRFDNAAFFKIAEGCGGHAQVLALFDRSSQPGYTGLNSETTTVDHIAFEIGLADFEAERKRLEQLGLAVRTTEHAWVHWRSLYVTDPEGHTVELVCYDASVE
jgi:catechol 2,3-dioxygenase-like lactoylglutathione lyase family enzyme